jgi:beta-glucan synthesis-associated protein KRE6
MVRLPSLSVSPRISLTEISLRTGVEFRGDPSDRANGFINWIAAGKPSAGLTALASGPDPTVGIGQRLISEEPMALVLNLGLSSTLPECSSKSGLWP